jgi:hypothetical protein
MCDSYIDFTMLIALKDCLKGIKMPMMLKKHEIIMSI